MENGVGVRRTVRGAPGLSTRGLRRRRGGARDFGVAGAACPPVAGRMRAPSLFPMLLLSPLAFSLLGAADAPGGAPKAPEKPAAPKHETAVLGGGCFWCVEAVYEKVVGVVAVESGYAGGHDPKPDYKSVCGGKTGHAEVVKITYDPAKVRYEDILAVFWDIHDPTTKDAQGADRGTQYRSIILYANPAQQAAALKSKAEAQSRFKTPIVTEIVPLKAYFPAEDYHQDYFRRNPDQPYCAITIPPKLDKLFKKHADKAVK